MHDQLKIKRENDVTYMNFTKRLRTKSKYLFRKTWALFMDYNQKFQRLFGWITHGLSTDHAVHSNINLLYIVSSLYFAGLNIMTYFYTLNILKNL